MTNNSIRRNIIIHFDGYQCIINEFHKWLKHNDKVVVYRVCMTIISNLLEL